MLTFLRSSSPVLVMISSMSVPICNHFYVKRANNGRITLFKGVHLFCSAVKCHIDHLPLCRSEVFFILPKCSFVMMVTYGYFIFYFTR